MLRRFFCCCCCCCCWSKFCSLRNEKLDAGLNCGVLFELYDDDEEEEVDEDDDIKVESTPLRLFFAACSHSFEYSSISSDSKVICLAVTLLDFFACDLLQCGFNIESIENSFDEPLDFLGLASTGSLCFDLNITPPLISLKLLLLLSLWFKLLDDSIFWTDALPRCGFFNFYFIFFNKKTLYFLQIKYIFFYKNCQIKNLISF